MDINEFLKNGFILEGYRQDIIKRKMGYPAFPYDELPELKLKKFKTIYEESMPYPFVHYPSSFTNQIFIYFSETLDADLYLCSCAIQSANVYNYGLIASDVSEETYQNERIRFINVKDHLCHRCNNKFPTINGHNYTHWTKSTFRNRFLWYLEQELLSLGIYSGDGVTYNFDCFFNSYYDVTPTQQFILLVERYLSLETKIEKWNKDEIRIFRTDGCLDLWGINDGLYYIIVKERNRAHYQMLKYVENRVRNAFHFKPVGEMWVNETILYKLVKNLYSDYLVIQHSRPQFLKGLELDVFVPELNLAFEYQGKQHYEPVEYFGGNKAYLMLVERDKRKFELCNKNHVEIIYIKYDEEITLDTLNRKLQSCKLPQITT